MNFSDQLKQYRKQFSLNQAELAKLLEVSPRSIWKWENGVFPHILTEEGVIQRLNQEYSSNIESIKSTMISKGCCDSLTEDSMINISTALNDCEWAKSKWIDNDWKDCIFWISNAILQLGYARSKIALHQKLENHEGSSAYFPGYITGEITGDCELHDQYKLRGYHS